MNDFWLKLMLLLIGFSTITFLFNRVMRKWLKVEKKKWFSYNHLNDTHMKMDWTLRISFVIVLVIGFFINVTRGPSESIWFLETPFLVIVFVIISETVRAIMEKKYAENKNDYLFTISQLVFLSIVFLSVFATNLFDLLW
ncbi:DUF4181 domain-containing protein [Bacillus sp. BHET2]|uniref:DUF4181 domain-containing protein n=1 Tax=Bacillus sp. BHET2 TaxID=2583818 RepID=UPI00110D8A52|nr:DUF4181 domain-containing protein [Bacillus sp. BHET2]TMU85052.1 DUF4181 domain-containing protein [Bacillus sp. BHET2]